MRKYAAQRASIRREVDSYLRLYLEGYGLNVTKRRVDHVMAVLRETCGRYSDVRQADISREVESYANQLIQDRPRRRRVARFG